MPDGRRKRRFSPNVARRRWYAEHRSRRFSQRCWSSPGWLANSRPQFPRDVRSRAALLNRALMHAMGLLTHAAFYAMLLLAMWAGMWGQQR